MHIGTTRMMACLTLIVVALAHTAFAADDKAATTTTSALSAAWQDYYKELEDVRARVEHTPRFITTPQHRAKAYHALMEIQAIAYNLVIAPRMTHPRLLRALAYQTDLFSPGLPGPDFVYAISLLDGSQVYRMRGRLANSEMFVLQVFHAMWGQPGFETAENIDLSTMQRNADGSFEITIGGPRQPGNWIPLNPQTDFQPLVVRRLTTDWSPDVGELEIERISPIADDHYDADEFDPAAQAKRIRRATDYIRFLGENYLLGLYDFALSSCKGQKNVLCQVSAEGKAKTGGSGLANYVYAVFDLADDEALLIDMPSVPDATYWSYQVGDVWGRSLPFQERAVGLNMKHAVVDRDGHVRVVLSKRDPGVVNWLDTTGRQEGIVLYRTYLARAFVVPPTRKVKLSELDALLPKDTKRISAQARREQLEAHRKAVLHIMDE